MVYFETYDKINPSIDRGINAVNFWNENASGLFDRLTKGKIDEEIPGEKNLSFPEYKLFKIYQELEVIKKTYNFGKQLLEMDILIEEKELQLTIFKQEVLKIYY